MNIITRRMLWVGICVFLGSMLPAKAQTAPVADMQTVAKQTAEVYQTLAVTPQKSENSLCGTIDLPENVDQIKFEGFCGQWMRELNEQCNKALRSRGGQSELLDVEGKELAQQCAQLQTPESILEAYLESEKTDSQSLADQLAELQQLSADSLSFFKQDEKAMTAAVKSYSGQELDPYTEIFPTFYLAGLMTDDTFQQTTAALRARISDKLSSCKSKTDVANCPLSDAAVLAQIGQSSQDAQVLANVVKNGHNNELSVAVLTEIVPGLVAMGEDEDAQEPVKQYTALKQVLSDVFAANDGKDTLWSWKDWFSLEGWVNLLDHALIRTARFSSGWQNSYYDSPDGYHNQLSAWAQVGQLIGYQAKQGNAGAQTLIDSLVSSRLIYKNNAFLLGVLAQGVMIGGKANTNQIVETMARNGMYDLKPATRGYMWDGLYTVYTQVLGNSKQQAANLQLFPRDSQEFKDRVSSAATGEHIASSFKNMASVADVALLCTGTYALGKGAVMGFGKLARAYHLSRVMFKTTRRQAVGFALKYGASSTGSAIGSFVGSVAQEVRELPAALAKKLVALRYRTVKGAARMKEVLKQQRVRLKNRVEKTKVEKETPSSGAESGSAGNGGSSEGNSGTGSEGGSGNGGAGDGHGVSGGFGSETSGSGGSHGGAPSAELLEQRINNKRLTEEFDAFWEDVNTSRFTRWYEDLMKTATGSKVKFNPESSFFAAVTPGKKPHNANAAFMYLYKISKNGHWPDNPENWHFVVDMYNAISKNPKRVTSGYVNAMYRFLRKLEALDAKGSASFFKARWDGGRFSKLSDVFKQKGETDWALPGMKIHEETDFPQDIMRQISSARRDDMPLQFAYTSRELEGGRKVKTLSLVVRNGRHSYKPVLDPNNLAINFQYQTARVSSVRDALAMIEKNTPGGAWRFGTHETEAFTAGKNWSLHIHREVPNPAAGRSPVDVFNYTVEIDIHDLLLEDANGRLFASVLYPGENMTIGEALGEGLQGSHFMKIEQTAEWQQILEKGSYQNAWAAWFGRVKNYRTRNNLAPTDPIPQTQWDEFVAYWVSKKPAQAALVRGKSVREFAQAYLSELDEKILLCELRVENMNNVQRQIVNVQYSLNKMLGQYRLPEGGRMLDTQFTNLNNTINRTIKEARELKSGYTKGKVKPGQDPFVPGLEQTRQEVVSFL